MIVYIKVILNIYQQWTRGFLESVPTSSCKLIEWVYPISQNRNIANCVATVTGMSSTQGKHVAVVDDLGSYSCRLIIYNEAGTQDMHFCAYAIND